MNLSKRLDKLLVENAAAEFVECPECGSSDVEKDDEGYQCNDCGHDWQHNTEED